MREGANEKEVRLQRKLEESEIRLEEEENEYRILQVVGGKG